MGTRLFAMLMLLVAACSTSNPPSGGKVEIVAAPSTGDLASYVAGEVRRGEQERVPVPVLVYVGATWCEPCRDFHAAAISGKLDTELGPLRLLEFDLDRDGTYLEAAGYRSQLVPLFARPRSDGRASGQQIDGVKTGQGYVEQLTPRIRALVTSPR